MSGQERDADKPQHVRANPISLFAELQPGEHLSWGGLRVEGRVELELKAILVCVSTSLASVIKYLCLCCSIIFWYLDDPAVCSALLS